MNQVHDIYDWLLTAFFVGVFLFALMVDPGGMFQRWRAACRLKQMKTKKKEKGENK